MDDSSVVNPLGHEIAEAGNAREVAVVRIDLDYRYCTGDLKMLLSTKH